MAATLTRKNMTFENFVVNTHELKNALQIVSRAVATRTSLPILTHVVLRSKDGVLALMGTDLEQWIERTIPALDDQEIVITCPAEAPASIAAPSRSTRTRISSPVIDADGRATPISAIPATSVSTSATRIRTNPAAW